MDLSDNKGTVGPSDEVLREHERRRDQVRYDYGEGKTREEEARASMFIVAYMFIAFFVAAVVVIAVLVFSGRAHAATTPQARVHAAMVALAGRPLVLNCTYAARGGAEAMAFPEGGPDTKTTAEVLVKPTWCGQARSFARLPTVAASEALLILTHESLHIRRWSGEFDEVQVECEALVEVGQLATALGAPASMLPAIQDAAVKAHAEHFPPC